MRPVAGRIAAPETMILRMYPQFPDRVERAYGRAVRIAAPAA
jgi:hypothetical protein